MLLYYKLTYRPSGELKQSNCRLIIIYMYLQKEADMTLEMTFHSLPCNTGSLCCFVNAGNKLAFWYQINWNVTRSGRLSVLLVELESGTRMADLGTNIDVDGAYK